jgi:lipoteichoic acid synthase
MVPANLETQGSSRSLLSRSDWVYLLSLLVPFVLYDLALKGLLIALQPQDLRLMEGVGLIRSDLLFNLGYVLLWVGLFAVARKGPSRAVVLALFHGATILVALITTTAYQYFRVTGSTLDSDYILLWLSSREGTGGAVASESTLGLVALILGIIFYGALGPLLVTRLLARWRGGWPDAGSRTAEISWLRLTGVGLAAYTLFSLSLLPGGESSRTSKSFSRDAFVNVVMTAAEVADNEELPDVVAAPVVEDPPEASLSPTAESERRNVVLIFLESTRSGATTPYNKRLETTPFMDELAESSLLVERAYAVVPHTHNAVAATNCGVEPPLDRWGTKLLSAQDRIPSICVADLLKEEGYKTAYFMSSTQSFERSPEILENLGYEEFYSLESMDTEGYEEANYFGYEDDVMLDPSEKWLQENGNEPFLATYLTVTPHHDYRAPQQRYGREEYTQDELLNRYLNSVRYQDFFLKNLFDQYKKLGLYEETVFIVLGDHGEGFGEHGRFQHDNTIYEEGLRIPMLIHDPKRFPNGARLEGPVNQLDILPTIADLLGYQLEGGSYSGSSLLRPLRKDRTLMFSCWNDEGCLGSLKGFEKYIYHFDDKPEEIFDLSKDPSERENLAEERSEEANKRRLELLEWRAKVNSRYGIQMTDSDEVPLRQ